MPSPAGAPWPPSPAWTWPPPSCASSLREAVMSDIGLFAQTACIWEATARKPGNVHPFTDFADTHYLDFLLSAAAIAPVLAQAPGRRIGQTVLDAVRATR